jgi:hypothetical protein
MRYLLPAMLLLSCSALTPAVMPDGGPIRFYMPEAASVQLVGDWNDWGGLTAAGGMLDPEAGAMVLGEDGFWTASPDLPRGRYRYAFLVDGRRLVRDELNPLTATWDGQIVSLRVIGD